MLSPLTLENKESLRIDDKHRCQFTIGDDDSALATPHIISRGDTVCYSQGTELITTAEGP